MRSMTGVSADASASSEMYSKSLRFSLAARRPVNATTAFRVPNLDVHGVWSRIAREGAVVR